MDKMNRRDFLGLGAAGAGFLATTALGMTPATASAKPIEYGPAVTLPDAQIPALTGDVMQHVEKLPIRKDVDVLVAGGGVAGVAAALAAKRAGKDVLLLEKTTLLGGLATIGLINYFEPLCNGRGKQVIFGMCEEFLRLSMKVGFNTLPKEWEDGEPKEPTNKRYTNRYSPQIFALQLTDLLHREGVQLLFDCIASTPVMEGGHCKGVIVDSKSGREFIPAKIVIDTTGDCDILYRAGVPTRQGGNFFTYWAKAITLESCRKAAEAGNIRYAFGGRNGGTSALSGKGHPEGMPLFTGTTVDNVTDYLLKNQLLMLQKLSKEDPKSREVITLPTMCQFRETRCIIGDHVFVDTDCYKHYDTSIAAICDFTRRDRVYEVPYGALCKAGYDNLLTGGRSASAEGFGWDVLRVIPPAIVTGEAAGYAASVAIDRKKPVAEIPVGELQKILVGANAPVHFDDSLIPPKKEEAEKK